MKLAPDGSGMFELQDKNKNQLRDEYHTLFSNSPKG